MALSISMLNKQLLALTVGALVLIQVTCVALHWNAIRRGNVDFAALLGTARLVRRNSVPNYDPTQVRVDTDAGRQQEAHVDPSTMNDSLHPPFEALIFLPLTFFKYETAFQLWTAINLILFWSVPVVLKELLSRLRPKMNWLAIVYATSLPVLVCLMFGQDSIVLLLLISLSVSSLARKMDIRAGFLLALGLYKFQLVLPVVAVLLVMRRWKFISGFCIGAGTLILAAVSMIGVRGVLNYFNFISAVTYHISTNASTRTVLMPNLRGLVSLLVGRFGSASTQTIIVMLLSFITLAAVLLWSNQFKSLPITIHLSAALLLSSLISYHYYIYNAVILAIPFLLQANEFAAAGAGGKLRVSFAACALGSYLILVLGMMGIVPLEFCMAGVTVGTIGALALTMRFAYDFSLERSGSV